MIIKSINLVNYRGLGNKSIDFEPDLTVVVGKNGSGKSSVLQAVATVASWIVARIKSEKGIGSYIDDLSITNGSHYSQIVAAFDEINKVSISSKTKSGLPKLEGTDLRDLCSYTLRVREHFLSLSVHHDHIRC